MNANSRVVTVYCSKHDDEFLNKIQNAKDKKAAESERHFDPAMSSGIRINSDGSLVHVIIAYKFENIHFIGADREGRIEVDQIKTMVTRDMAHLESDFLGYLELSAISSEIVTDNVWPVDEPAFLTTLDGISEDIRGNVQASDSVSSSK